MAIKCNEQALRLQVAQFVLFFGTAAVFMLQPVVAPGQIAAVFATFGILYALQVPSIEIVTLKNFVFLGRDRAYQYHL